MSNLVSATVLTELANPPMEAYLHEASAARPVGGSTAGGADISSFFMPASASAETA
jgi:hypothetical protein